MVTIQERFRVSTRIIVLAYKILVLSLNWFWIVTFSIKIELGLRQDIELSADSQSL